MEFKVGELVKIIKSGHSELPVGEIHPISKISFEYSETAPYHIKFKGIHYSFTDNSLERAEIKTDPDLKKTKIQIGWKAKSEDKSWWFIPFDYSLQKEPKVTKLGRNDFWVINSCHGQTLIENHPEQPEIPWEDSLQPVFIEV